MNKFFGICMIISGIFLGVYAGIWWAFIGGIIDIVNAIKSDDVVGMNFGIGILKIMLASPISWICTASLGIPGFRLITKR